MEGERGQAGKLQRDEENPFRGLDWAEKGRRWGCGVQGRRQPWRAAVAAFPRGQGSVEVRGKAEESERVAGSSPGA